MAKAGLYEVRGAQRFCGPAAVSALTGMTTDEAAAHMRRVFDRRSITGTTSMELLNTLGAAGCFTTARPNPIKQESTDGRRSVRPTLAQWAKDDNTAPGHYLVMVTGHWVAVHKAGPRSIVAACAINRTPRPIAKFKGKGARVRGYWVVRLPVGRARKVATAEPNPTGSKACGTCGEMKPLGEYPVDRHRKDGHRSQCRPCMDAADKRRAARQLAAKAG